MDNNNNSAFDNIEYQNKIKPVPIPDKINDIDTKQTLYDNIINAGDNGILDLSNLNSFTNISQSRDEVYNLLDIMAQDPIISTALDIYASDACEPNDQGQIVWAESDDDKVLGMVQHLLDSINIDKNAYNWVYSLIKYGDLYLKLYRDSEYNDEIFKENKESTQLNEDINIKAYSKNDHYAEYMEAHRNPAEIFDLQRMGKSTGYIRSHITPRNSYDDITTSQFLNMFTYNFNRGDIDIYPATEFVHASLNDNSNRTSEEVSIINDSEKTYKYSVKRGQSILYNVFKIWRELSLLENSVLLNRITKSSIIRTVSIEVGDMERSDVSTLINRVKQMVEQKSAINVGKSLENYTNPGPIENIIYIPTHDGKGKIETGEIGGQVENGNLVDLEYFREKLFGSLGIPKQYLGCLRGNTPILLLNGKTITVEEMFNNLEEYLGKGIMACNENGSLQPTVITNIALTKPSTSFLRIHLDNGEYVDVTEDHKMMLRDGSFVYAKDLEIGDSLMPYYDKVVDGRRWVLDNKEGKYKKQYRVVAESVCDVPKGYQVHHIDERKINDDFDNLIPLSLEEHYKQHTDMLHEKANKKIAEKRAAGLYSYRDITNGVEYRKINTLISDLPEGWWFEGCPKPEGFGAKISAIMSNRPKNYDCYNNFGDSAKRIAKTTSTKAEREAAGLYADSHKAQAEKYSKWASEHFDELSALHQSRFPENRINKKRYVRCLCCGAINEIRCNDDWYNEYLNEDLFWFCSKECSKLNGKGKLARSYKLFLENDCDYDKYEEARWLIKPDIFFKPETLTDRLEYIKDYVPECNHKVVGIEFIDVDEPAYDISVEADCHTFALPCGIFVHNCTNDSTGFNGGSSLSLISSQYAKKVKKIQNAFIQAITDAMNLMLLNSGLTQYINKFTIKMQSPTTQEEKDRKENLTNSINNIREIMSLVEVIDDQVTKLNILKSLLSNTISDVNVITAIQDEIDKLELNNRDNIQSGEQSDEFGEGDIDNFEPMDFGTGGSDELPTPAEAGSETPESTEMPMEEPGSNEEPEESFYNNKGGEILNEENYLPSFEELGIDYINKN